MLRGSASYSFLVTVILTISLPMVAQNPYLPLWEYIPDAEPYVFEDPDRPGEQRVYIYGSHDLLHNAYCGRDQVVWSAPVDDLSDWRYDGLIFKSEYDRDGNLLNADGQGDILYAPDVAEVVRNDGKKVYYLYPNNQSKERAGMVAVSDRPDGPFKVCNWSKDDPRKTEGPLSFDPQSYDGPFNQKRPFTKVVNNTDGSVVGFKYFDFSSLRGRKNVGIVMDIVPMGVRGSIEILVGGPSESKGGVSIGRIEIGESEPGIITEKYTRVSLPRVKGKQSLFFRFTSDMKNTSMCDFIAFRFTL